MLLALPGWKPSPSALKQALGRDAAAGEEEDAEELSQHFQESMGKVKCIDGVQEARNPKLTQMLIRNQLAVSKQGKRLMKYNLRK